MFALSAIWFCAKRMPRILALCFNVITIFLAIFLLLGCYHTNDLSTFLVSYEFNSNSPFYTVLQNSFKQEGASTTGLESVIIKSGYMGICIDKIPKAYNNNSTTVMCYSTDVIDSIPLYNDLSIQLLNIQSNSTFGTTSSKLNILELAKLTSHNVIHPYILMATIVLTCVMFILTVYVTIPFNLPLKFLVSKLLLLWSSALVLLWGIGATWSHIGVHASAKFIPAASLNIINVHKGKKAGAMSWFSFAFLITECVILWFIYIRDRKSISDEINEVHTKNPFGDRNAKPYDNPIRNMSDSSTLHSKV